MLGLLVALSLLLLTAYFGESGGGGLHSIQRGFLEVVSPIQDGASRALKPIRDLIGWIGDTLNAKSQRDKLQKELNALTYRYASELAAARQATQFEGMLGIDRSASLSSYRPVTARVIGVAPTVWYATITIDAGSSKGVTASDPVINGSGLVGKVTTVTPGSSVVTLISDSTSGVSARDASNGALGIVQPAVGNPNDLLLQFVPNPAKIQTNDIVVTSGTVSGQLDSLFPPNIPIGRVTSVNPGNEYESVHVAPLANLRALDFVQVLARPSLQTASAGGRG